MTFNKSEHDQETNCSWSSYCFIERHRKCGGRSDGIEESCSGKLLRTDVYQLSIKWFVLERAMDESLKKLWVVAEFVALGTPSVSWVPFQLTQ